MTSSHSKTFAFVKARHLNMRVSSSLDKELMIKGMYKGALPDPHQQQISAL